MTYSQIILATTFFVAAGSLGAAGTTQSPATFQGGAPAQSASMADDAFVSRLYQDLFGRAPKSAELDTDLTALKAGTSTRAEVATRLFNASEFHDAAAFPIKCYQLILRRDLDLAHWSQVLKLMQSGATEETVLVAFMATPEYAAAYPASQSDANFVATLYQNVLGRQPDADQMDAWRSRLSQGAPHAEVVQAVLTSPEFETQIANRLNTSLAFLAFLRRDTNSASVEQWSAALDSGVSISNLIESFVESPEYAARFE